jgi:hypothetical protein
MFAVFSVSAVLFVISWIWFLASRLDSTEAKLKQAQAELAKYRRKHDSRGRFTK